MRILTFKIFKKIKSSKRNLLFRYYVRQCQKAYVELALTSSEMLGCEKIQIDGNVLYGL